MAESVRAETRLKPLEMAFKGGESFYPCWLPHDTVWENVEQYLIGGRALVEGRTDRELPITVDLAGSFKYNPKTHHLGGKIFLGDEVYVIEGRKTPLRLFFKATEINLGENNPRRARLDEGVEFRFVYKGFDEGEAWRGYQKLIYEEGFRNRTVKLPADIKTIKVGSNAFGYYQGNPAFWETWKEPILGHIAIPCLF